MTVREVKATCNNRESEQENEMSDTQQQKTKTNMQ